jgi:hypothetical protein
MFKMPLEEDIVIDTGMGIPAGYMDMGTVGTGTDST